MSVDIVKRNEELVDLALYRCLLLLLLLLLLRSTKENAFIVRSDFENFGPFIDTDLAPPKNSSGANDVIAIYHVLQPRSQGLSSCGKM